ncbi:DUF397 domain-containing protein [Streptomyces sp. NPDC091377]|uniref:DUF397 domain-containing protein n=1 Tax=Streptomyces sp. NPDC091377 TaxID=3365995 RepID=UPI0038269B29
MTVTNSPPLRWVKSSYSVDNGGACLEWAPDTATSSGVVPLRDSKNPSGPVLNLSAHAFAGLVALARSAEL